MSSAFSLCEVNLILSWLRFAPQGWAGLRHLSLSLVFGSLVFLMEYKMTDSHCGFGVVQTNLVF